MSRAPRTVTGLAPVALRSRVPAARSPCSPALLSIAALALLVAAAPAAGVGGPELVAVYPNPVADGDRGEHVVVRFPRETALDGWTVADDHASASLPNATVRGRVAFGRNPATTRTLTDAPVYRMNGSVRLANGGDVVRLKRGDTTVDAVRYDRAPESERWTRSEDGWEWEPLGATDRPVATARDQRVTAFVLPDSPAAPLATLQGADRRILLAAYTLSSERVVGTLRSAAARDVIVRVLVDGGPVGGMTERQAAALDSLSAAGVDVQVLTGERARYAFHHAKYAVVDDRAVVLTENWKPSGTGGRSSRGWGVEVRGETADHLATVFAADANWKDTESWEAYRTNRTFADGDAVDGSYPERFSPETTSADAVHVLTAPDNAEPAILRLLDSAEESIAVQQVSVGGPDQPYLRAAVAAAERGVEVRILLGDAWYVREGNAALAERLNDRADERDLPLEVRLAAPRSRYGKIHSKGVVVDEERALVGSVNWNNHSSRENREVALLVEDEVVGRYYARVFRADWRGGAWRLPAGLVAVTLFAVVGAVAVLRRVVDAG